MLPVRVHVPPETTVNVALVALLRLGAVATSVYPVPARSIERPLKLAMPAAALPVVVPKSIPPLGFVPIASVTASVASGTALPSASRMITSTAGQSGTVASASVGGSTVNVSWAAT
jgi:hypothetical protein